MQLLVACLAMWLGGTEASMAFSHMLAQGGTVQFAMEYA